MAYQFGPDNPFFQGFETDPRGQRANYFSFQGQFGRSPNQKKWFQGQFEDVQNKYLGLLGQTIRSGGQPVQTLSGYLGDFFAPGGGAQQQWASMPPRERGVNDTRFAPAVRWRL